MTGEMDDIDELLGDDVAEYDLAFSVYALYYARDPNAVLQTMLNHLSPGGRLAIIGPDSPHGLVELVRLFIRFQPRLSTRMYNSGSRPSEPFFRSRISPMSGNSCPEESAAFY